MAWTYNELAEQMDAPTQRLLLRIVENHLRHLESSPEFHVIPTGRGMILQPSAGELNTEGVSENRMADLIDWGLLRQIRHARGGRGYTAAVKAEAVGFYRFLDGSSVGAIEATQSRATRETSAESVFSASHPDAATHLREANLLLSNNDAEVTVVIEVGSHLRAALHAVAAAVITDYTGSPEKALGEIVRRLRDTDLHADAAAAMLADYAHEVLQEAQRLDHVKDEEHKGRTWQGWEEMRRAVALATVACTELAHLKGSV